MLTNIGTSTLVGWLPAVRTSMLSAKREGNIKAWQVLDAGIWRVCVGGDLKTVLLVAEVTGVKTRNCPDVSRTKDTLGDHVPGKIAEPTFAGRDCNVPGMVVEFVCCLDRFGDTSPSDSSAVGDSSSRKLPRENVGARGVRKGSRGVNVLCDNGESLCEDRTLSRISFVGDTGSLAGSKKDKSTRPVLIGCG